MTDAPLAWRKSSFSSASSTCVEMAPRADGTVLVRNSNHPDAGTLAFSPTELHTWIAGCKTGDLDDLDDLSR